MRAWGVPFPCSQWKRQKMCSQLAICTDVFPIKHNETSHLLCPLPISHEAVQMMCELTLRLIVILYFSSPHMVRALFIYFFPQKCRLNLKLGKRSRKSNFPKYETTVLFNRNHISPLNYGTWGSLCKVWEVMNISFGRVWGVVLIFWSIWVQVSWVSWDSWNISGHSEMWETL